MAFFVLQVVLATEERITSIVILGCICCLFQCLMTFFILIIYCLQNRTWLNFLKLQCCSALIGAMAIFVYAIHSNLPQVIFQTISKCQISKIDYKYCRNFLELLFMGVHESGSLSSGRHVCSIISGSNSLLQTK